MRMSHSPAAATAMIAILGREFVVLIGSAATILVAVGLVGRPSWLNCCFGSGSMTNRRTVSTWAGALSATFA
jgi:hypothetical protein